MARLFLDNFPYIKAYWITLGEKAAQVALHYGISDADGTIVSENESSAALQDMLEAVGSDAFKLAEFGVGTNPKAKLSGKVLEDEKIRGTVHFAFGNDLSYNGDNDVPIHLDGIVCKPTVVIDGVKTHEKGKLLLKSCTY